jgi:hypothetical protein
LQIGDRGMNVCIFMHIACRDTLLLDQNFVDLIRKEIVDLDSNTWCNQVDTTSQPMRMLRGDSILMTPTSLYV